MVHVYLNNAPVGATVTEKVIVGTSAEMVQTTEVADVRKHVAADAGSAVTEPMEPPASGKLNTNSPLFMLVDDVLVNAKVKLASPVYAGAVTSAEMLVPATVYALAVVFAAIPRTANKSPATNRPIFPSPRI
jgi:hypothetical protein